MTSGYVQNIINCDQNLNHILLIEDILYVREVNICFEKLIEN